MWTISFRIYNIQSLLHKLHGSLLWKLRNTGERQTILITARLCDNELHPMGADDATHRLLLILPLCDWIPTRMTQIHTFIDSRLKNNTFEKKNDPLQFVHIFIAIVNYLRRILTLSLLFRRKKIRDVVRIHWCTDTELKIHRTKVFLPWSRKKKL